MREEAAAVRTCVIDKWKKLQGMSQEQAMVKYMALVKEWKGYGSTLFNVEVRTCLNNLKKSVRIVNSSHNTKPSNQKMFVLAKILVFNFNYVNKSSQCSSR